MERPFYRVLGVSPTASQDEIKSAYRVAARKAHPDRAGGNKEEFQRLEEAYSTLSDPERRARYDAGLEEGQGQGPSLASMFGQMFANGMFGPGGPGGGGGPRKRPKGDNKHHEIGVTLREFYHGKTFTITMKRDVLCTECASRTTPCETCKGNGFLMRAQQMGPMMSLTREGCGACQQTGVRASPCSACGGRRVKEVETTLDVVLRPGMSEGDRIVFPRQCSESPLFVEPGDVVLVLRAATDDPAASVWERNGLNLRCRVDLTLAESLLGWERILAHHPSVAEGATVRITGGGHVREGTLLRVPGAGLPGGDMEIECHVVEEILTNDQQNLLRSVWPEWTPPATHEGDLVSRSCA